MALNQHATIGRLSLRRKIYEIVIKIVLNQVTSSNYGSMKMVKSMYDQHTEEEYGRVTIKESSTVSFEDNVVSISQAQIRILTHDQQDSDTIIVHQIRSSYNVVDD